MTNCHPWLITQIYMGCCLDHSLFSKLWDIFMCFGGFLYFFSSRVKDYMKLFPLIYSSMPCLRGWKPLPHGHPTQASRCAACHVVAMATLAAAACQTFMLSLPLHARTKGRTQSWCCRLHGKSSQRNAWLQMWHLTSQDHTVHPVLTKHTIEMPLLFLLLCVLTQ